MCWDFYSRLNSVAAVSAEFLLNDFWLHLLHLCFLANPTMGHSFIHSFILNIYIAPLQENYSEALPTPARLKRAVLVEKKNAGDKALGKIRSWEGSPFQIEGPTTENARRCLAEVRANDTRRRPCWDERRDRELIAPWRGQRICMYMNVYACICLHMYIYVCICNYMFVRVCMCRPSLPL